MPEIEYVRVTDEVKPRREYSVVASAVDPEVHKVLKTPGVDANGNPLDPKYTPESLAGTSGQPATTTTKES